jgi:hypothetical protein
MKSIILWWTADIDWSRRLARFARPSLIISLLCSLFAASANAAPFVYVVTITQQFGIIDLADGKFTPIGNGTPDGLSNLMWSPDGSLLSLATTGNHAGYLATINPATGKEVALRAIKYNGQPLGYNAFSLAEVRDRLYLTDFSNNLYFVNPVTGNATPVGENGGTTGLRPDANVPFTTNADGTFNLCDEGLYEFDGKLYATFDSFAIDTTQSPPAIAHKFLSPYVWQIDPLTGAATFIANTDWQINAIVEVDGRFYAFKSTLDGFEDGFPVAHDELDTLDLRTGKTSKIADIDPSIGIIFGATPVHRRP